MHRNRHVIIALWAAALALGPRGLAAQTVKLTWSESGASKLAEYRPQRAELTENPPDNLKKMPTLSRSALFGVITLGPRENPTHFDVALDPTPSGPPKFFIDQNGNGDLTDHETPKWTEAIYSGPDGATFTRYLAGATLQLPIGNTVVAARITLCLFDPRDNRSGFQNTLLYAADYSRVGTITLGEKRYHAMLSDNLTSGDFRGRGVQGASGVCLYIDVNGNGVFDPRGEAYDVSRPFNIAGTTYEITGLTASGDSFEIIKSDKTVPEILPPPDLSVGKKALPFTLQDTSGATIRFPEQFRGKLVLLYFWASWCGDCEKQVPFVTGAYAQFHARGLEIVGASLDHATAAKVLADYTKSHNMPWPQIFDGKMYESELMQLYYVRHTPTPYLVDGDTGTILATEADLQDSRLAQTIKAHLKH